MYTFTSDTMKPVVWNTYKQVGMVFCDTIDGLVLLGHGSKTGQLNAPAAMLDKADFIAVCYPEQVKRAYPQYAHKVLGDWNVKTEIHYKVVDGITFITVNPQ